MKPDKTEDKEADPPEEPNMIIGDGQRSFCSPLLDRAFSLEDVTDNVLIILRKNDCRKYGVLNLSYDDAVKKASAEEWVDELVNTYLAGTEKTGSETYKEESGVDRLRVMIFGGEHNRINVVAQGIAFWYFSDISLRQVREVLCEKGISPENIYVPKQDPQSKRKVSISAEGDVDYLEERIFRKGIMSHNKYREYIKAGVLPED